MLRYFWHSEVRQPPAPIRRPEEYSGGANLSIVCTQTGLPSHKQRKLVAEWCDALPKLRGIRCLWLNSRTPQKLFDAACLVPGLKGLYIKLGAIESLEALASADDLVALHVGSSPGVTSIEPLSSMSV